MRGEGRIRNGNVDIELRIVDDSGAIVAIANAHGKARDLRDVVIRAVGELAAQVRGKLQTGETPPATCDSSATSGCFGVRVTVEGEFDQAGGWGSGSVSPPAGHGAPINEGFDSVEHGSFGYWPNGTPFALTAVPHMGSHLDHAQQPVRGLDAFRNQGSRLTSSLRIPCGSHAATGREG